MRLLFAKTLFAVLLLLATPLGANAQDDSTDATLDALFAQLKAAPDPVTAQIVSQRIWFIWLTPRDPELLARMQPIMAARERGELMGAIELLDQLVIDYPDYAEGWNQRATLHYMTGNYDASLLDIEKTLEHEPRHFGALSGRALIYLAQENRPLALREMARALELHPFLAERQLFPELAEDVVRI